MNSEKGFSLIEMLTVMGIISILSFFAFPQYATYKGRSFDTQAKSDLRNLMTAEEAFYIENSSYTSNTSDLELSSISGDTECTITSADTEEFLIECYHPNGRSSFCWDGSAPIRTEIGTDNC